MFLADINRTFLWIVSICLMCTFLASGTTEHKQSPAFHPAEMYRDMFPLTSNNFTEKVLRYKDPWIIIFHDGTMEKEWKTMATHLRGLCWIGMIDVTQDDDFLKSIEYDSSIDVARVYPYGDRLKKERNWKSVKNQNEARAISLKSLPDKTQRITGSDVEDIFMDCFMSTPSKFPAYIITDGEETPHLFKALSLRFEKYFMFGKVVNPSTEDLKGLGLDDHYISPPALFVIVTPDGDVNKANAIKYDIEHLSQMNYTTVMKYLFAINSQFRHTLPGENQSNRQQEAEMSDILEIEGNRFDIVIPDQHRSSSKDLRSPAKTQLDDTQFTMSSQTKLNPYDEL